VKCPAAKAGPYWHFYEGAHCLCLIRQSPPAALAELPPASIRRATIRQAAGSLAVEPSDDPPDAEQDQREHRRWEQAHVGCGRTCLD